MNLYMIEYYDPELDITDYKTVTANNKIDAMKYFIRSTHGTKLQQNVTVQAVLKKIESEA